MKILFPQNIFSSLLVESLPQELVDQISYMDSARLFNELENGNCDAALIPTLELVKNKDLFISKKMCIAFYSYLCNSYIYFAPDQQEIEELTVKGDMSSNDIIIAKYLFSEMYGKEIKISLTKGNEETAEPQNLLLVGDGNLKDLKLLNALSISEEISEMISFPYVNYVLASKSGVALAEINEKLNDLNVVLDENIEKIVSTLNLVPEAKDLLVEHAGSISFVLNQSEENGVTELLRLPYFHGMIDDIIEAKYV